MRLYCGIDLHGDNGFYAIVGEDGKRLYGKRLPNDMIVILQELMLYEKETLSIAVESTYNWYWLVDGLMEHGYNVILANPAAMTQYSGIKNANDKTDAFFIAEQLRLGLLKTGYIYPKEDRGMRDILRRRMLYSQQKTAQLLSFGSLYSRQTGGSIGARTIEKLKESDLCKLFPDVNVRLMAEASIKSATYLDKQIHTLEKHVLSRCKLKESFQRLLSVPGIGNVLGLMIMLETGDIGRFPAVGNYTSYCRGVKAERESNEKKKGLNNRRNGNKYLSWAYIEAANFMLRFCPEAKCWYQRKLAKTKRIVALKALSAKIAKACYFIMRDQVEFDMKKIFA
jgi:transposase